MFRIRISVGKNLSCLYIFAGGAHFIAFIASCSTFLPWNSGLSDYSIYRHDHRAQTGGQVGYRVKRKLLQIVQQ